MISYEIPAPENIELLPEESLNYLDINSINALRTAQDEFVSANILEAGVGLMDPVEIGREIATARTEAKAQLDDMTREYLLQYIPEDDPKFDEYLGKLREYSIDNMSTDEMARGPRRADGTFADDLAGWRRLLDYRTNELVASGSIDPDTDRIADLTAETTALQSALGLSRTEVAKRQVGFRHKGLMNRKKQRVALAEAKDSYNLAVREYAKKFFELAKTQNPTITEAELRTLSAQFTASEFGNMTTEQAKSEYITNKYGKAVRKIASIGIVKKVALGLAITSTVPLALVFGGGALSFAAIGIATAYRGTRAILNGPISHSTERGSTKLIGKLGREELEAARRVIGQTSGTESDNYAEVVASSAQSLHERIHKSDRTRRKVSAAITAAALIPIVGGVTRKVVGAQRTAHDVKGSQVIIDKKPPSANGSPGGGSGVEATLIPDPVEVPQVIPTGPGVTDLSAVTPEQWQGLMHMDMMTETGGTPWVRASHYFNGDAEATRKWLNEATARAGGSWHNLNDGMSTNDWIDIKGASDTDAVWKMLVNAHPVPRVKA